MTRLEDRQILLRDITQARADGSRLAPACALAGLDPRTLQRWKIREDVPRRDRRAEADRPVPSHALSEARTGTDHRGGERTTLCRGAAGADRACTG